MQIDITRRDSVYNSRPFVEDADDVVRDGHLTALMVKALEPIFLAHGMAKQWGIGLIHRHWDINAGEMPGESLVNNGSVREYVMKPVEWNLSAYVPCFMTAVRSSVGYIPSFRAVEFSSDDDSLSAYNKLKDNNDFLSGVYSKLIHNNLETIFGLISLKCLTDEKYCLIEDTILDKRVSIRREVDMNSVDWDVTAQTGWIFPFSNQMGCRIYCYIGPNGKHKRGNHTSPD